MPLAASDFLRTARAERTGVGAFNLITLEQAEAYVQAAERVQLPIILQFSENAAKYHGGLEPLGRALLALAESASVPVVVHLDHAEDESMVAEAVDLGFTSVMFDASKLPYAENEARTAEVTRLAHGKGVWVEAELGEVGGKDGAHAPGVKTDPQEAAAFVAATEVDSLAIAVGSSHAMLERVASLDLSRIAEIYAAVDVPLVLHGSSGVPDETIAQAVRAGISKVNVFTHLNKVFSAAVRDYFVEQPQAHDPRKYLAAGQAAIGAEAERLLRVIHG